MMLHFTPHQKALSVRSGSFTKSAVETKRIANFVIHELLERSQKDAAVIGLSGELGAGKTTLAKGFGKALGIRGKIQSPTFVLMKTYKILRPARGWKQLVHIDAYRFAKSKEAGALGLKEIFRNKENLVVIEWPERIRKYLPQETVWVELKHKGGNHRHIIIKKTSKS